MTDQTNHAALSLPRSASDKGEGAVAWRAKLGSYENWTLLSDDPTGSPNWHSVQPLYAHPSPGVSLPDDVVRLVIAAREVAFGPNPAAAIDALDKASEAFASRVPWEDDPASQREGE